MLSQLSNVWDHGFNDSYHLSLITHSYYLSPTPTTYYLLAIIWHVLLTTYYLHIRLLNVTHYLLPSTYYLLPITYYLLPTTDCPLPITYYLLFFTHLVIIRFSVNQSSMVNGPWLMGYVSWLMAPGQEKWARASKTGPGPRALLFSWQCSTSLEP